MKKKKHKTNTDQAGFNKKQITVAVSGGFDPLHIGHIRMFKEAKKLGTYLVVILNNDNWLKQKKGFVFMGEGERKEIIEAIAWVDRVIITRHPKNPIDMSVAKELQKIQPHIFANGGDRKPGNLPTAEEVVCKKINCHMVYSIGVGGKVQSSSFLATRFINDVLEKRVCPCGSGKPFTECGLKRTKNHTQNLRKMLNR